MKISDTVPKERIRSILEQDLIWSVYALADLDPEHDPFSEWHVSGESLLLRYSGLASPILFAIGEIADFQKLLGTIPSGEYQISFPQNLLFSLPNFVSVQEKIPMLRMYYTGQTLSQPVGENVRPLGMEDLAQIEQLFAGKEDAPDGYHPRQVSLGPFAGIWDAGKLIATAGVHVLSKEHNLAALGNIYTHPEWRRRGFARACTTRILFDLMELGATTIVLNVGQENMKAIKLYQSLGFISHCPFYEGIVQINPTG